LGGEPGPVYSRLTAHEWGTFTSIADSTGIHERATLYSSTEYKKVRLLYFTDAFEQWEAEHA